MALAILVAGSVRATDAATNATLTLTHPSAAATNEAVVLTNETAGATNETATAAAVEPTIVTSERLNVDYLSNLGTFSGNVLVIDPRITVRADTMVVHFGEPAPGTANSASPTLQRIEADGGVVITTQDRKAESEHAVYTASDGKVVLTGNPQPRVEGEEGTVTGPTITFWLNEKRMEVESGTRLILYPEEQKKPEQKKPEEKPGDDQKTPATPAP